MKTTAESMVDSIARAQRSKVIEAIKDTLTHPYLYTVDETECEDKVSTFVFTFNDDSQLRIDTQGYVYSDQDLETAYRLF